MDTFKSTQQPGATIVPSDLAQMKLPESGVAKNAAGMAAVSILAKEVSTPVGDVFVKNTPDVNHGNISNSRTIVPTPEAKKLYTINSTGSSNIFNTPEAKEAMAVCLPNMQAFIYTGETRGMNQWTDGTSLVQANLQYDKETGQQHFPGGTLNYAA
jgi:hypothetical protein